jgi:hypothetical protein
VNSQLFAPVLFQFDFDAVPAGVTSIHELPAAWKRRQLKFQPTNPALLNITSSGSKPIASNFHQLNTEIFEWTKKLGISACAKAPSRGALTHLCAQIKESKSWGYPIWKRFSAEDAALSNVTQVTTRCLRKFATDDLVAYVALMLEVDDKEVISSAVFDPELRKKWPSVNTHAAAST